MAAVKCLNSSHIPEFFAPDLYLFVSCTAPSLGMTWTHCLHEKFGKLSTLKVTAGRRNIGARRVIFTAISCIDNQM